MAPNGLLASRAARLCLLLVLSSGALWPLSALAESVALRVAVVHDAPLLRSESRALDALVTGLRRHVRGGVVSSDASPAEVALVASHRAHAADARAGAAVAPPRPPAATSTPAVADAPSAPTAEPGLPPAPPPEWQEAQLIVLLEVLPPSPEKGGLRSRGLGLLALYRGASVTPVFLERVTSGAVAGLGDMQLEPWLTRMVAAVQGAK